MLLALLGALVIGASLGVMGSGGSILTVPVLIYVLGHADKPAIAESLAIVGGIAFIGAIPGVLGRIVHWRTVLLFGVPAMVGRVGITVGFRNSAALALCDRDGVGGRVDATKAERHN